MLNDDDAVERIMTVHGLTQEAELLKLLEWVRLAPEKQDIVELGTFNGRSTAALCHAANGRRVMTIDSWEMQHHGKNNPGIVQMNLARLGYHPLILSGKSHEVPPIINGSIGFLLIDTDHRAPALRRELDAWLPLVHEDGIVAMHDYGNPRWDTMKPQIDKSFADWERLGLARHMIGFRRWPATTAT